MVITTKVYQYHLYNIHMTKYNVNNVAEVSLYLNVDYQTGCWWPEHHASYCVNGRYTIVSE